MDRYADALASRIQGLVVPAEWRSLRGPRFFDRYGRYPWRLRRYGGDFVHVADHTYAHCLSAFVGCPSVVTIHDLYPLHQMAQAGTSLRGGVRDRLLSWSMSWARRADRWIVGSTFTAEEAERLLGLPRDRVAVIPYGVDEAFAQRPGEGIVESRRRAWLGEGPRDRSPKSILHVGSCAPRKNLEAAIAAVGLLRRRGVEAVFIQIGGRFEPHQLAAIRTSGLEGFVRQEPNVNEVELVAAYFAADALLLPSTYEGFGLPVLEAFAAGLPVVTSGAGGLRDAAGDAAVIVPGAEPADLAIAMEQVLTGAVNVAELRERGQHRAQANSWNLTASRTEAIYDELLGAR
jgi:alpha-1,3-rhamnosyl/mannosyltransferase